MPLAHLLPALERCGTGLGPAALTSFGVRGTSSRSPVLPTPPATLRCTFNRSLATGKVCLQLTRCAWRGCLPRPLPVVFAFKVGSARWPGRHRRAPHPECRLTCRSTGAPTAWHLGREALVVHVAPRGPGATPSSPGYLYVRPTVNAQQAQTPPHQAADSALCVASTHQLPRLVGRR